MANWLETGDVISKALESGKTIIEQISEFQCHENDSTHARCKKFEDHIMHAKNSPSLQGVECIFQIINGFCRIFAVRNKATWYDLLVEAGKIGFEVAQCFNCNFIADCIAGSVLVLRLLADRKEIYRVYNEDGWKAALNECLTTICKDGNGKLIGSFVGGAIGGAIGGCSGACIGRFIGQVFGSAIGGEIAERLKIAKLRAEMERHFQEELENIRSQHRQEKADLERSKNSELDNKKELEYALKWQLRTVIRHHQLEMKATETNVMQAMKTTHQHEMDEVQELLVQERQEKAELERSMKKLKELDVHREMNALQALLVQERQEKAELERSKKKLELDVHREMEAMQALLVQERREKAELERSMKLELDAQKLHLEMVINNHQLEMNAMQTMKTTHQRDAELKLSRMILELDIQLLCSKLADLCI